MIADLQLVFEQKKVIKSLRKRGRGIIKGNQKKRNKAESKLQKIVSKNKNPVAPRHAYITFEEEAGREKALGLHYSKLCCYSSSEKQWHGSPLHFESVMEPSNIIWENEYQSKSRFCLKMLYSVFIIAVCILVAFSVFFFMKKSTANYKDLYPQVNCAVVKQLYPAESELKKYSAL